METETLPTNQLLHQGGFSTALSGADYELSRRREGVWEGCFHQKEGEPISLFEGVCGVMYMDYIQRRPKP